MSKSTINRRDFIRQSACAALGVTAMVNTMAYLRLTSAALAQNDNSNDYKALVCVFLSGGNDSNNLIVPTDGVAGADYLAARPTVALRNNVNNLVLPNGTAAFDKYYQGSTSNMASHPSTPEIAEMFNDQELAFVCNVGTLAYPFANREDYTSGRVPRPLGMYAHNVQQQAWQTSVSDQNFTTGWGGRTADLLNAAYNSSDDLVSMNITMNGMNVFQRGNTGEISDVSALNNNGNILDGYSNNNNGTYNLAYRNNTTYPDPAYLNSPEGQRLRTIDRLLNLSRDHLMERELNTRIDKARVLNESGILGQAVDAAVTRVPNINNIFNQANNSLGSQLRTVAELIIGRSALGNKRQVFFVEVGGYDNHNGLLNAHAPLMRELSTALKAFRDALVAADDFDKVVAFTASDFNRTMNANGGNGTDHAWAGHSIVMGGEVAGGNLYGHFPSLKMGSHPLSIDADVNRGHWIPSVSVDQYASVMTRWMGADSNSMETIFPNLPRFNNPLSTSEPNLAFIPSVME